jgi:hypothetical protein
VLNQDVDPTKFQPSEMLRLNTAVPPTAQPNRLGVLGGDPQGYPNGRRLADDALDISLQAVEGAAVTGPVAALAAGDRVDRNDRAFGTSFPYLALPNTAAVNTAVSQNGAAPVTGGSTDNRPGSGLAPNLLPAGVVGAAAVFLAAGLFLTARHRRLRPLLSA